MNATTLITQLREQGARLVVSDGSICVDAPEEVLDEATVCEIRRLKPEILQALSELSWNKTPDSTGANTELADRHIEAIRRGNAVLVWSAVLGEWLWWVRDDTARQKLIDEGCTVPIYSLGELVVVGGWETADLQNAHSLKRECGATILPP